MKRLSTYCFVILLAVLPGCQSGPGAEIDPLYRHDGMYLQGVYRGTVPCADCEGIDTELVVWSEGEFNYGTCWYRLTETYLGKPAGQNTFTTEGAWYLERGSGDNEDDTTMALELPGDNWRRYVVDDADTVSLLSGIDNKRIVSDLNYSLKRVK